MGSKSGRKEDQFRLGLVRLKELQDIEEEVSRSQETHSTVRSEVGLERVLVELEPIEASRIRWKLKI